MNRAPYSIYMNTAQLEMMQRMAERIQLASNYKVRPALHGGYNVFQFVGQEYGWRIIGHAMTRQGATDMAAEFSEGKAA